MASKPQRRGLRRPKRVDPEQIGQGAVVDADGRGDLEKPDQLETIQSMGAGLVAVNLRQARVDGGVGDGQAVDVGEPEEPTDRVH